MEDVRVARDFGLDALVLGRVRRDGVVERERAVDDAALDLSAAVHLREQRGVDGRRHVGVDYLDGGESGDLRAGDAEGVRELDDVLDDVDLDLDVGIHVEGGVGDEEYAVVALDLVDVDVGEGLSAAEALFLVEDAAQEVRGGDHALHDYLGLTGRDELDGLERRGGFSALLVDYLVVGEVYAERSGDFLNLVLVAYEDGVGYSGLAGAFDGLHDLGVFGARDADLLRAYRPRVLEKLIKIANLFHIDNDLPVVLRPRRGLRLSVSLCNYTRNFRVAASFYAIS